MRRLLAFVAAGAVACGSGAADPLATPTPALEIPGGPVAPEVAAEMDLVASEPMFLSRGDISVVAQSDDLRLAWPLVDLLRFHEDLAEGRRVIGAIASLTGKGFGPDEVQWVAYSDWLLENDVPAPPGYLAWKRDIYVTLEPGWEPFFDDAADIDWREVSWGGVARDGIEALVDAPVVPARRGGWIGDEEIVFGVVVGEEARAYPQRVMKVHEMANDTLGGQRIAVSFCTLCGSAIAYATELESGTLELRTSGLLKRSNKLMFDAQTESLWDQFDGLALAGPLRGTTLGRFPLQVTTWGAWKEAHPGTTITAEGAGTDRVYDDEPLFSEEVDGPFFPVGEVDDRLPPKEEVLGVETIDGAAIAFPVAEVRAALGAGETVALGGVEVVREDGLVVARPEGGGGALVQHQAFWFAWSQFRVDTKLWQR